MKLSQKDKDKFHMISVICGLKNMAQMNLSTKQKQTHRHREQTCGCRGEGGGHGWTRSLGSVDASYSIYNGQTTRSHSIAQGTISNLRG